MAGSLAMPRAPSPIDRRPHRAADDLVERLKIWLHEAEADLQEHEQLVVRAIAGVREVAVDFIRFHFPDLIAFAGVDLHSGSRATLLVHPVSVQLLCTVETIEVGAPRRSIGFQRP